MALREHGPVDELPAETLEERKQKAMLDRAKTLVTWESDSASGLEGGPVKAAEKLRRALTDLDFDSKNQFTKLAVLSLVDSGFSVDRCGIWNVAQSMAYQTEGASSRGRTTDSFVEIEVEWLRSLQVKFEKLNEHHQAVVIYDTLGEQNPSHAEAFLSTKFSGNKPILELQVDIFEYLRERLQKWPKAHLSQSL